MAGQEHRPIIDVLETGDNIGFVKVGSYDTPHPPILSSSQISQPGIATHETASGSDSYLIVPKDAKLNTREYMSEYSASLGEKRFSVYNGFNEDSVEIILAGLWRDQTLLPGSVKTMHKTKFSQTVMRNFQAILKKQKFTKVLSWWISPEALQMLRAGKRLSTTAVQSPPEYDLRLENLPPDLR